MKTRYNPRWFIIDVLVAFGATSLMVKVLAWEGWWLFWAFFVFWFLWFAITRKVKRWRD